MSVGLLEERAPASSSAAAEPDYLALLTDYRDLHGSAAWTVQPGADLDRQWIRVAHAEAITPAQGWKLHLSASVVSAEQVLRRALPLLLAEPLVFKVAGSRRMLAMLNQGEGQLSQVGKFITTYPRDESHAVRLAVALDAATRGLSGPAIPSDRALTPGSIVHYRFGGFHGQMMQTPVGELLPALVTPDGSLVPDRRLSIYQVPAWSSDPFLAAGVATPETVQKRTIGDRYIIVTTLHRSPRGMVYLAMDLREARRCVLKRALRGATIGPDGRDACDRLRHEAAVLAALPADPGFPALYDLLEQDGDLYMALEDVEGETLEAHVGTRAAAGQLPTTHEIVSWGKTLTSLLAAVHAAGYIYRDLKTPNVMVAPDGRLRLLDFELAQSLGTRARAHGYGTRGYVSPQQAAGEPSAVTDDIYGLGALLYYMATAAEPSQATREFALLDRPIQLLNPAAPEALIQIIERCLSGEPAERYQSMQALQGALDQISSSSEATTSPPARARSHGDDATHFAAIAVRLGDTIHALAQQAPDGSGLTWASKHPLGAGVHSRDINVGSAGTVLALAELVDAFDRPLHRQTLAAGAASLAATTHLGERPLPGLYVGEAGVGAALLRAGQVLGDGMLVGEAARRGALVAAQPFRSPDLFNGTAGRLRFHLWLYDETHDPVHLGAARAAGEALLAGAEWFACNQDDACRWPIPAGYDGLSGTAYAGYAHGASGIADALLDLYEATTDMRFLSATLGAARWLSQVALPALPDGSGLDWPPVEGAQGGRLWCHGAVGTGRFFLHAGKLGVLPGGLDTARRACLTALRGARNAGPVQCHGLAGNIEFALDCLAEDSNPDLEADLDALARLLESFSIERDGQLMFPSESPHVFSPDYMVGFAGIALCFTRLAHPGTPHQLSRAGFRYRHVNTLTAPLQA